MKKHKNVYIAGLLLALSSFSYANENNIIYSNEMVQEKNQQNLVNKEESSQFKYLNISTPSISSLREFGYYEINEYIQKKEQNRKIQSLARHISNTYKLELEQAKDIVSKSFEESEKHDVEPLLLLAIINIESKFKQKAQSNMGAVGLTQVMPQYHQTKVKELKKDKLDIWSIEGNIRVGVQILKEYIQASDGDIPNALQRYNGSFSDPSKGYSRKVLATMRKLKLAIT